ncbi:MAG: O-methyltransferase [Pseudonocardia sp.]
MTDNSWTETDTFLTDLFVGEDGALQAALAANAEAGLPPIDVSPPQGKLLHLLARAVGARRILEVGTLGGYSTIWLARALPADGRLVTCEIDPRHAAVARANLERAGLAGRVEVVEGPALTTIAALAGPFDLVFADADKPSNADYFARAVELTRPGGLIVVDNVVRQGGVVAGEDPNAAGSRRALAAMAADPRVVATAIQTVGSKGHDGFAIALRL